MKTKILSIILVLFLGNVLHAQPQRIERNVARSKATVSDIVSERGFKDGELVTTQGYEEVGDGGGNSYRYHRTGRSGVTIDNGFFIAGSGSDDYFEAVDQTVVIAKQFGVKADGVTNDSAAMQAAINAMTSIAKSTLELPEGTILCNVTITTANTKGGLRGKGEATILQSFATNDFPIRINASFPRSFTISKILFTGASRTKHGLYFNGGAGLYLEDCKFEGCGIGICTNGSIANYYKNVNLNNCYCGCYFTTRATGNLDVTDVAGQTVTLSNRIFGQHSGLHEFYNLNSSLCDIAIYQDNLDNPFSDDSSAIHIYGGLIQGGEIGVWLQEGGYIGNPPTSVIDTWMECSATPATVTFNGNTQDNAEFICVSGRMVLTNTRAKKLVAGDTGYIEADQFTCEGGFEVVKSGRGSVVLKDCYTDNAVVDYPCQSMSLANLSAGRTANSLLSNRQDFISIDPRYNGSDTLTFSTPLTVDFDAGNYRRKLLTLTDNSTVTLDADEPGVYYLLVRQDGTGSRTITWDNITGDSPTVSGTASKNTMVVLSYDGTNWTDITEGNYPVLQKSSKLNKPGNVLTKNTATRVIYSPKEGGCNEVTLPASTNQGPSLVMPPSESGKVSVLTFEAKSLGPSFNLSVAGSLQTATAILTEEWKTFSRMAIDTNESTSEQIYFYNTVASVNSFLIRNVQVCSFDSVGEAQEFISSGKFLDGDLEALGEELIPDPYFDGDGSEWVTSNSTVTVSGGQVTVQATSSVGTAYIKIPTEIGQKYRATFTVLTNAGGFGGARKSDNAGASSNVVDFGTTTTANATGTSIFTATASTTYIVFQKNGDTSSFTGDFLSVRKVLNPTAEPTIERNAIEPETSFSILSDAVASSQSIRTGLVSTKGYSASGDGGATKYIYHRTGRPGSEDGGSIIFGSGSDDYFEAVFGDSFTMNQFGVFTGLADNQTQLQRSIDYAISSGKQLLITGNVNHSDTIEITGKIHMEGVGELHSFTLPGNTVPNVHINVPSNTEVIIKNINTFRGSIGWHIQGGYLSRFSQLDFLGASGCTKGFFVENGIIGCQFTKWVSENCTDGIHFKGSDIANGCHLDAFRATGAEGIGIYLECTASPGGGDFNAVTLTNPIIETNAGVGLAMKSVGVALVSPWFESNGLDCTIDSNYNGATVTRCTVTMLNPHFSVALQSKRVEILNAGITFNVYGGTGGSGSNNLIDGNGYTASSRINLVDSPIAVESGTWADSVYGIYNFAKAASNVIEIPSSAYTTAPRSNGITFYNTTGDVIAKSSYSGVTKQRTLLKHDVLPATVLESVSGVPAPSNMAYFFRGGDESIYIYDEDGIIKVDAASEAEKILSQTPHSFDAAKMVYSDDGTTPAVNGTAVQRWSSVGSEYFSQATSLQRPTYRSTGMAGLPAIEFDGSDDTLVSNTIGTWVNLHNGVGGSIVFVVQIPSSETGTEGAFWGTTDTSYGTLLGAIASFTNVSSYTDQFVFRAYRAASNATWVAIDNDETLPFEEPIVIALQISNLTTPELSLQLNETIDTGAKTTAPFTNSNQDLMTLGAEGDGSNPLNYLLGELHYFRKSLTRTEMDIVVTHLRDKYSGPSGDYRLRLAETSADPSDPVEGTATIWQSDGTGSGRDGDILAKVTADGNTNQVTLFHMEPVFNHGNLASGTSVFAFSETPYNTVTATGDINISFSATRPGAYYGVVTQDGTGSHTVTISTTVVGTGPTIRTGANEKTLLPVFYDGTTWFWIE